MEVIVNPLGICRHNCRYCLASGFNRLKILDPVELADKICSLGDTEYDIAFNGGDPILLGVSYYVRLASILINKNIKFTFDIVSAWNKEDAKRGGWLDTDSIKQLNPFTFYTMSYDRYKNTTKNNFKEIYLYLKNITGRSPGVITVLTRESCRLHQELYNLLEFVYNNNGGIKLNRCLPLGNAETNKLAVSLPYYLLFFVKLIYKYKDNLKVLSCEDNLKNIYLSLFTGLMTSCPISTTCNNMVTIFNTGETALGCGLPISKTKVKKQACFSCILYKLCNSCKYNIDNITEEDCKTLNVLLPIIKNRFKLLEEIYNAS